MAVCRLVAVLMAKGTGDATEAVFRQALGICDATLGPKHPNTAGILGNFGSVLHAKGDYAGGLTRR